MRLPYSVSDVFEIFNEERQRVGGDDNSAKALLKKCWEAGGPDTKAALTIATLLDSQIMDALGAETHGYEIERDEFLKQVKQLGRDYSNITVPFPNSDLSAIDELRKKATELGLGSLGAVIDGLEEKIRLSLDI